MKIIWNKEIASQYHKWKELYDEVMKVSFVILRWLGGIPLCLSNNSKVSF